MPSQPNRILLPIDVTHPTKDLVNHLSALIPLQGAEVLLLSVREELPSYERMLASMADFPEDIAHRFKSKAESVLKAFQDDLEFLGAKVKTEIVSGPAGMMIDRVARDENYNQIFLAPGSHSRVETFLLGSTSARVVKHAPGTVVVLREPPEKAADLKHVVFGVDGSPQSRHALLEAVDGFQLKERGTAITLCHVVAVPGVLTFISPVEFVAALENNLSMEGETILAAAEKALSEKGIKNAELMLRHGDPSTELIQAAKARKAGMLVIGAQGRTAVQHFLLGSVSTRIATHAECSVAVVKMAG
ncbi:MAG TPA: universal stress protein [Candidatus Obscuribacterales bacterium]